MYRISTSLICRNASILGKTLNRNLSPAICSVLHRGQSTKSNSTPIDIGGMYPPIVTPFDHEENIYWDKLEHNIRLWNKIHFKGYVVQGSNGEYAFLTPEERVEMVSRVRRMAPKDKLIIAGSGCESTRDTVKMTQMMADAGADATMVVTPCYYKGRMTNDALVKHYTQVADQSPVPIILYSVPVNTSIDLSADVVIELAQHPNIIGMKDSNGDISKLAHMVYKTQELGFQVLAGSASFLYAALAVGCVGGVCALANVLGQEVCQLGYLYSHGRHDEAKQLQHRLVLPNMAVTRQFGVAGLKQSMEWYGYYGGPTRSPLQPLTDTECQKLTEAFETTGFLKL